MARPKSELTGVRPYDISARLTPEQRIMYVKLSGSKWLRAKLQEEIAKADTLSRRIAIKANT